MLQVHARRQREGVETAALFWDAAVEFINSPVRKMRIVKQGNIESVTCREEARLCSYC
jgi:hypothetical protein